MIRSSRTGKTNTEDFVVTQGDRVPVLVLVVVSVKGNCAVSASIVDPVLIKDDQ